MPATPDGLLESKDWQTAGEKGVGQTAKISGSAWWFPNTEGFRQFSLGPGQFARGYLALTDTTLQFRDRTQQANTPSRWSLPYGELAGCTMAKFGLGRRVVVRTCDQQIHSFTFDKSKLTEAAYRCLTNQIAASNYQPQPAS